MDIQIAFNCSIIIEKHFEQKYSGWLEVSIQNEEGLTKKFWFMSHFPHESDLAEVMFYYDEEMTKPFLEGLGCEVVEHPWKTNETRVKYNFFDPIACKKVGSTSIIFEILMLCIESLESEIYKKGEYYPYVDIKVEGAWGADFEGDREKSAQTFLEFMKA